MKTKGTKLTFTIDLSGKSWRETIKKSFYLYKYTCEECDSKYRAVHVCMHD